MTDAAIKGLKILVFYGSYRTDRAGIRLANYLVSAFNERGQEATLIDAKEVNLPIIDKMYKEYAPGTAPANLEKLAQQIKGADAFVFVTGEYNWGAQPGLKNLTDYFLEEWFHRPAAIASYSAGRFSGVRSALMWRNTLGEMGMVVISQQLAVGGVSKAFKAEGEINEEDRGGAATGRAFPKFAQDLEWWADAAKVQKGKRGPPYE